MMAIWIIGALFVGFVVGGIVGYRLGVIHGYDKAEAMIGDITTEQYERLRAKE